ncbi:MAG TPA: cytidine deaminase [Acidobacteriaceae bacterium]|jgi:cytidine deaminase|nr:cytidine deaminase [Acidobacteriaceae bacterium]
MTPLDLAALDLLRESAAEAAARAYAPYSRFYVGAALLLDDGSMVTGCNVENMSYGLTSCAERNALFRAICERGPGRRIRAIAVANRNGAASPPCGACRQVLSEFVTPDAVVCFPGERGPEVRPFAELFPFGFALEPRG